ncbi:unnamed protein product [Parnassius apollo]|uniref:(apollo) hypothetical protein n=1 Tax=Parnassius apollo TaxID=110799 RepID=A0A8S3XE35_PARAO|nr:unnamed protein product [Parnassius apollo]
MQPGEEGDAEQELEEDLEQGSEEDAEQGSEEDVGQDVVQEIKGKGVVADLKQEEVRTMRVKNAVLMKTILIAEHGVCKSLDPRFPQMIQPAYLVKDKMMSSLISYRESLIRLPSKNQDVACF